MSRVYLDRAIHTTIAVMSVLIVYDGWQNLKLGGAVGVILGPVLAMFISLTRVLRLRGRPPGQDRLAGPQAPTVVMGLIVGVLVLALQVFLQPGRASLAQAGHRVIATGPHLAAGNVRSRLALCR